MESLCRVGRAKREPPKAGQYGYLPNHDIVSSSRVSLHRLTTGTVDVPSQPYRFAPFEIAPRNRRTFSEKYTELRPVFHGKEVFIFIEIVMVEPGQLTSSLFRLARGIIWGPTPRPYGADANVSKWLMEGRVSAKQIILCIVGGESRQTPWTDIDGHFSEELSRV